MITGFLLTVFYYLALSFLGLLPTGALGIPTGFTDAITLIAGYLNAWNWLLPVDQLVLAVVTVVGFYAILLGFRIALWIIHLVRGN